MSCIVQWWIHKSTHLVTFDFLACEYIFVLYYAHQYDSDIVIIYM